MKNQRTSFAIAAVAWLLVFLSSPAWAARGFGVSGDTVVDTRDVADLEVTNTASLRTQIQPKDVQTKVGKSVKFQFYADGQTPITYQWYFVSDFFARPLRPVKIEGATSRTLSIAPVKVADAGFYFAVATGPNGVLLKSNYAQLSLPGQTKTHLPVLSPRSRSFSGELTITMTCATPGAQIQYLLNGDSTAGNWQTYDPANPPKITESTILHAFAQATNARKSNQVAAGYTKNVAGDDTIPGQYLGVLRGERIDLVDRVERVYLNGSVFYTDIDDVYRFTLDSERDVNISISDFEPGTLAGRLLDSTGQLIGKVKTGAAAMVWKAQRLPAGVYFVKISMISTAKKAAGFVGSNYRLMLTDQSPGDSTWDVITRGAKAHHIGIFLSSGAPIQPGKASWLDIHGRESSPSEENIKKLAAALDGYEAQTQVIMVDWATAAADNFALHLCTVDFTDDCFGVEGRKWIEAAGKSVASRLKGLGIFGDKLNIAGHSWGTYVGHEIAAELQRQRLVGLRRFGCRRFIALDPAAVGFLNTSAGKNLRFNAVAAYSVAFLGRPLDQLLDFSKETLIYALNAAGGRLGSPKTASTAHDSFVMVGDDWGLLAAHSNIVFLVADIIGRNKDGNALPGDPDFSLQAMATAADQGSSRWNAKRNFFNENGGVENILFERPGRVFGFEGVFEINDETTVTRYPQ